MNQTDEKSKAQRHTVLIFVLAILTFLVAVIGATFAYFAANIKGNESAHSVLIKTDPLTVEYKTKNEIRANDAAPGFSKSLNFSITNSSKYNTAAGYQIWWNISKNTIVGNDFVYTLSGSSSNSKNKQVNVGETVLPKTTSRIGTIEGVVSPDSYQDYVLTVKFKEKNENQDENINKQFIGKIEIKKSTGTP